MGRIILILLLCSNVCFSQTIIYSKVIFANEWAYTPDSTFNLDSNTINFTSYPLKNILFVLKDGTDSFWHNYERWEIVTTIELDSLPKAASGFKIGCRSSSLGSLFGVNIKGHGGVANHTYIYGLANGSSLLSHDGFAFTRGTIVNLSVKRDKNMLIYKLSKQGDTTTVNFQMQIGHELAAAYDLPKLISNFYIQFAQGSFKVINVQINSSDGCMDFLSVGNSISQSTGASNYFNGWNQLLKNDFPNTATYAGASSKSSDVLKAFNGIIKIKPHSVLLEIGTNDLITNLNIDTLKRRITRIVDSLVANNITPIFISLPPISTRDVRYFNCWEKSTFYQYKFIDVFTALADSGTYIFKAALNIGDGVHPNDAGHTVIENIVDSSLKAMIPKIVYCPKCHKIIRVPLRGAQNIEVLTNIIIECADKNCKGKVVIKNT
jgi:lysophospholipase L1-like esterase